MSSPLNVSVLSKITAPGLAQKSAMPAAAASALLVTDIEEDRRFLDKIFIDRRWTLFSKESVEDARLLLRENPTPVVLSDRDAPGGGWKKLLSALQQLERPPLLIVTSRLADDHLWAEVLNLGGHDVLATPFRAQELVWVLENAWRHCGVTSCAKAMSAGIAAF